MNTARGPLIDEPGAHCSSRFRTGRRRRTRRAWPPSRSPRIHRCSAATNVIISPHTAFYSIEALNELQTKCATDVARVLSGEKAGLPDQRMMILHAT